MNMLDWLARAERPFDRGLHRPGHATGSGMVISTDGRVALIFHKKLLLWCQPGGHAEPGETDIADVAAREASEELGVTIHPAASTLFDLDVHRVATRGEVPSHLHFDFRFLSVIDPVELPGGSDACEARWFTRDELRSLGLDAGLRRMVAKAETAGLLGGWRPPSGSLKPPRAAGPIENSAPAAQAPR